MADLKLSVLLQLKDRFSSAITGAKQKLKGLGDQESVRKEFDKLTKSTKLTALQFDSISKRTGALAKEIKNTESPSRSLRREFDNSKRTAQELKRKLSDERYELERLRRSFYKTDLSARDLSRSQRKLIGDTRTAAAGFEKTNRKADALSGSFAVLGGWFLKIAAAQAALGAAKGLFNFEAAMARLQTDAGITAEEVAALRDEIERVATLPDIRVSVEKVQAGVQSIIDLIGYSDDLVNNIETLARIIQASGANGEDAGAFMVELFKKGLTEAKELETVTDKIVKIGQKGSFVFRDLAKLGPRLFTAIPGQNVDEIAALAQVTRTASGSSEQATTGIEALGRVFTDAKKIKDIQRIGVQVFKKDDTGKQTTELRNINDILEEIINKTKGDPLKISKLIGDAESMRVFKGLLIDGNIELLNRLRLIKANGETLKQYSQINANTVNAITESLKDSAQSIGENQLEGNVKNLSKTLDQVLRGNFKNAAKDAFIREVDDIGKDVSLTSKKLEEERKKRSDEFKEQPKRETIHPISRLRFRTTTAAQEAIRETNQRIEEENQRVDKEINQQKIESENRFQDDVRTFSDAIREFSRIVQNMEAKVKIDVSSNNARTNIRTESKPGFNVQTEPSPGVRVEPSTKGRIMREIGG